MWGEGDSWTHWEHLDAQGTSGGILVMWDGRVVSKIGTRLGKFSVSCYLQGVVDESRWVFSGVYKPCKDARRK